MDDQTLLSQYVATGDAAAFAQLTERHLGMVRAVCLRVLGNSHDAEEIAQECFFELSRHAAEVHTSLPGWLHRAATSRSLNAIRSRTRRKRRERECGVPEEAATVPAEANDAELRRFVQGALKELPDDLRLPVVLHYVDGKTQRDVALRLGVNQSTISRRMQDALRLLREKLTQAGYAASAPAVASFIRQHAVASAKGTVTEIAVAGFASQTGTSASLLSLVKLLATASLPILGYLLFDGWISLMTAVVLLFFVVRFRPVWASEVMASFGLPDLYQQPIFQWADRGNTASPNGVRRSFAGYFAWSFVFATMSMLFVVGTANPPWGAVALGLLMSALYLVHGIKVMVVHRRTQRQDHSESTLKDIGSDRPSVQTLSRFEASLNWFDAAQMATIGLSGIGNSALVIIRGQPGTVWPALVLCAFVSAGMVVAGSHLVVRLMRRLRNTHATSTEMASAVAGSQGTVTVMASGTAIVAMLSAWIVLNPGTVRSDSLSLAAIQTSMLGWMVYRIAAFHRLTSPLLVRRVVIAILVGCFVLNSGVGFANWLPTGIR